jgi:hypothetical protein
MFRSHRRDLAVAAGLLCLGAVAIGAQNTIDPFLGTWRLNRAASTFDPGPPPESRTTTFEMVGDAVRHTTVTRSRWQNENNPTGLGGTDRVEYTAKLDGQDVPITNSFLSRVSLRRIDARTIERTGKLNGEVVETSTRTVSKDGRTLTITTKGTNDAGPYSSVQVFERVKP